MNFSWKSSVCWIAFGEYDTFHEIFKRIPNLICIKHKFLLLFCYYIKNKLFIGSIF